MIPAIRLLATLAGLTLCVLLCGCIERVGADLPVDRKLAAQAGKWELAGRFGGNAELAVTSDDPWKQRFTPGTFGRISGLCATDSEVWVTDLHISRLQVFGFDGELKHTYGSGVPLKGTLLSDAEFAADMDMHHKQQDSWEATHAQDWVGHERQLFQAADVAVDSDGYWLADWVKTRGTKNALRPPGLIFVPLDAARPVVRFKELQAGWPAYLARGGNKLALSEPLMNTLNLIEYPNTGGRETARIGEGGVLDNMLTTLQTAPSSPRYLEIMYRETKASGDPGRFFNLGGAAIAFDKVLACDTGNKRIEIFDARKTDDYYWGHLVRMVEATDALGHQRFDGPRDIDVASDGRVYVLDTERMEVVELSPQFERLGVVAKGLADPYAIDLSDDGRHLFISERGGNEVLHYARSG